MDAFSESPLPALSPTDRLSERQKQCLELVAKGNTSKQIGRILNLSPSTVDNHLNTAVERLGVGSRVMAAKLFVTQNQDIRFAHLERTGGIQQQLGGTEVFDIGSETNREKRELFTSAFSIPPVGGKVNRLSQRRRYYHVIQIMLLALMAFSAVTITIAGIVHLFSK